jgi:hypothetical protein
MISKTNNYGKSCCAPERFKLPRPTRRPHSSGYRNFAHSAFVAMKTRIAGFSRNAVARLLGQYTPSRSELPTIA